MSSTVSAISRWLMPRAYMDRTFPSIELTSVVRFGTDLGENEPSRSRGERMGTSPKVVFSVFSV